MAIQPVRSQPHLRCSDIDANFHLRHSVYYDLCAQQRMELLHSSGATMGLMQEHASGPIIFREECMFRHEIKLVDTIDLEVVVKYLSKDLRKFSFVHQFVKADGTLCATLTVEGAWMDTRTRKVAAPPLLVSDALAHMPFAADFSWRVRAASALAQYQRVTEGMLR